MTGSGFPDRKEGNDRRDGLLLAMEKPPAMRGSPVPDGLGQTSADAIRLPAPVAGAAQRPEAKGGKSHEKDCHLNHRTHPFWITR